MATAARVVDPKSIVFEASQMKSNTLIPKPASQVDRKTLDNMDNEFSKVLGTASPVKRDLPPTTPSLIKKNDPTTKAAGVPVITKKPTLNGTTTNGHSVKPTTPTKVISHASQFAAKTISTSSTTDAAVAKIKEAHQQKVEQLKDDNMPPPNYDDYDYDAPTPIPMEEEEQPLTSKKTTPKKQPVVVPKKSTIRIPGLPISEDQKVIQSPMLKVPKQPQHTTTNTPPPPLPDASEKPMLLLDQYQYYMVDILMTHFEPDWRDKTIAIMNKHRANHNMSDANLVQYELDMIDSIHNQRLYLTSVIVGYLDDMISNSDTTSGTSTAYVQLKDLFGEVVNKDKGISGYKVIHFEGQTAICWITSKLIDKNEAYVVTIRLADAGEDEDDLEYILSKGWVETLRMWLLFTSNPGLIIEEFETWMEMIKQKHNAPTQIQQLVKLYVSIGNKSKLLESLYLQKSVFDYFYKWMSTSVKAKHDFDSQISSQWLTSTPSSNGKKHL